MSGCGAVAAVSWVVPLRHALCHFTSLLNGRVSSTAYSMPWAWLFNKVRKPGQHLMHTAGEWPSQDATAQTGYGMDSTTHVETFLTCLVHAQLPVLPCEITNIGNYTHRMQHNINATGEAPQRAPHCMIYASTEIAPHACICTQYKHQ